MYKDTGPQSVLDEGFRLSTTNSDIMEAITNLGRSFDDMKTSLERKMDNVAVSNREIRTAIGEMRDALEGKMENVTASNKEVATDIKGMTTSIDNLTKLLSFLAIGLGVIAAGAGVAHFTSKR